MKTVLVVYCFLPCVVLASSQLWNATTVQLGCTESGKGCNADCTKVIQCVWNNPSFIEVVLQNCDTASGQYCSLDTGECSSSAPSCVATPPVPFECHSVGMFPDPFDCTKYYLCTKNGNGFKAIQETCETGWAYDPLSTGCKYQLTDPVCLNGPVPSCDSPNQAGPLVLNPSIFYFCLLDSATQTLVLQLYACDHGYVYDADSLTCLPPSPITSSQPSEAPPPVTPPKTSESPLVTTPSGSCTVPGLYPDDTDCTAFYMCTEQLEYRHGKCFFMNYFHPYERKCVFGFC